MVSEKLYNINRTWLFAYPERKCCKNHTHYKRKLSITPQPKCRNFLGNKYMNIIWEILIGNKTACEELIEVF